MGTYVLFSINSHQVYNLITLKHEVDLWVDHQVSFQMIMCITKKLHSLWFYFFCWIIKLHYNCVTLICASQLKHFAYYKRHQAFVPVVHLTLDRMIDTKVEKKRQSKLYTHLTSFLAAIWKAPMITKLSSWGTVSYEVVKVDEEASLSSFVVNNDFKLSFSSWLWLAQHFDIKLFTLLFNHGQCLTNLIFKE